VTEPGYEVRSYRAGDEVEILALFEHVFPVKRGMDHWRWKFLDNPAGRHISLAVAPGGAIVGQFAGLPAIAVQPSGTFVLSQGIDHMVHPDHQGRGVFAALTRHFLLTVLAADERVVFYSYPLAEKHSIDRKVTAVELVHPVSALGWDLSRAEGALGADRPWTRLRHRVETVARFGGGAAALWERTRTELGVAAVRDPRYLNWRYADCPDVDYTLLQVRDRWTRRVAGLAVLRFGWFEEPIAALVDWLVPARATAAAGALLAACHAHARASGCRSVRTWLPPSTAAHRVLAAFGYEREETPFLLTTLADADRERARLMKSRWFYTMGDSDIY
jgi:hypothetical protein